MQEHEVLKRQRQHICLDIGKSMEVAFQVANVQGLDQVWILDGLDKDVVEEHGDVDGGNDERSSFEHGPPTTTD